MNNAYIPSTFQMRQSTYGGVQPIQMNAPVAPRPNTAQARADVGQATLPNTLTAQGMQTMGVPKTPTKGLIGRKMPGFDRNPMGMYGR